MKVTGVGQRITGRIVFRGWRVYFETVWNVTNDAEL